MKHPACIYFLRNAYCVTTGILSNGATFSAVYSDESLPELVPWEPKDALHNNSIHVSVHFCYSLLFIKWTYWPTLVYILCVVRANEYRGFPFPAKQFLIIWNRDSSNKCIHSELTSDWFTYPANPLGIVLAQVITPAIVRNPDDVPLNNYVWMGVSVVAQIATLLFITKWERLFSDLTKSVAF